MGDNLSAVINGLIWIQGEERARDPALGRPAIPYLIGALTAVTSPEEKSALLSLLATEYGSLGLTEQQVRSLEGAAELSPTDPSPWSDLSDVRRLSGELEQSVEDAKRAVAVAESSGKYRRHALQTLARSLKASRLYVELETVLDTLLSLKSTSPDAAIELDFLVDLPDGVLAKSKVDAYRSLRK